jgi:predicted aspartyl protease
MAAQTTASRFPLSIDIEMGRIEPRKHGPLLPAMFMASLDPFAPRVEGCFLIDTGAPSFMIDRSVAEQLGLTSVGHRQRHGVDGFDVLLRYSAHVAFNAIDQMGVVRLLQMPIECDSVPELRAEYRKRGVELIGILGRDFLEFCDMRIDGKSGRITLLVDERVLSPGTD